MFALIFYMGLFRPFLEQKDPRGTLLLRLKIKKNKVAVQYKLQCYRKAMETVADIESSQKTSPWPRNANDFLISHPFLLCSLSLPIYSILGSGRSSSGGISPAKVSKERLPQLHSAPFFISPTMLEKITISESL